MKVTSTSKLSTEEKIKEAARTIFHQSGFAAARTRDIARLAGINLALVNYYFRSKEKLFNIIMLEGVQAFFRSLISALNDPDTSFDEKTAYIVSNYIDLLSEQPDIPLFVLNGLRTDPKSLIKKVGIHDIVMGSHYIQQLEEGIIAKEIKPIHPLHFIMNLIGLTVFPFMAGPIIRGIGELSTEEYQSIMQQRKIEIPIWIKSMLQPEEYK